ncbi:MAG: hypothetical protein DYG89_07625 [Caldilinea sp. CFX5]|nr:hypothetical protein [Caldilinea sp. CFX5]
MSFDWRSYLTFAEKVSTMAVSRAYYAVYCATRNLVKQKDNREFSGNAHQGLHDYLKEHAHPVRRQLGRRLHALHQLRKKADYEDDLAQPAVRLAGHALKSARDIEANLEQLVGKSQK